MVKPVIKWCGGKSAIVPQLLPLFPSSFNRYFEPFMGGGAVFLSLDIKCPAFLNDINREIIELYEVIRDEPNELMEMLDCFAFKYSEEFYYQVRACVPDSKLVSSARTIFLNKTCFNGLYRQNSKKEFNVPFGKRVKCPALYNEENIYLFSKKLKQTEIEAQRPVLSSLDFEEIINQAGNGDLVYCDPPYYPVSKTSSFTKYQSMGFTANDQIRLRDSCIRATSRGAHVVVSNSPAPFIADLYKDHTIEQIVAKRVVNPKGDRKSVFYDVAIVMQPEINLL